MNFGYVTENGVNSNIFLTVCSVLITTFYIVTVHSVHSNVAKIHSRLPAAMEFWLVCLGILAYSCQNTSQDSGVLTVTNNPVTENGVNSNGST